MKRINGFLIVVLIMGCILTGCGNSDGKNSETNANGGTTGMNTDADKNYVGYVLSYKGVDIKMNDEAAAIIEALGEPDNYFESESCAFQGLDKVYTYASVILSTYPEDGKDYVYTIELKDDTVETAEGIYIGASKDDVHAAYGTPSKETEDAYIYEKGESQLSFIFEDGVVKNIIYMAVTE